MGVADKRQRRCKLKTAIFNPYLDTLGGGERYTASFAKVLLDLGYEVYFQWESENILKKLTDRFGIDLAKAKVVEDVKRGEGSEVCFWVSDGSIPLLRSRHNFLHFQFPFTEVNGNSVINRMKFIRIEKVLVNSHFTKKYIDKEYGVNSMVLYPPVDVVSIKPRKKENIILSVGRFSQLEQAKRQDILVDVFERLLKSGLEGWRLVLAGGAEVGADIFLKKLKKKVENKPIEIIESPDYSRILKLFGKAKIFWTATGYGVNEYKEPKKVEHFGISVVEAMAAGAVPCCFNAGGHKEIIVEAKTGFLWKKKSVLRKKTQKLIEDKNLLNTIAEKAREASLVYEYERFKARIKEIIQ
jgi:glycosyltransferase involved in cell wall biosynthesis